MTPTPAARLFSFVADTTGTWRVESLEAVTGPALAKPRHLSLLPGAAEGNSAAWVLRGITSNERYVTRPEKLALASRQEGLGRSAATRAALIPIRKSAAWWALTQDERRDIFEAQSAHIAIGLEYLPAIARRLHHCRDLGPDEPFDFLTWFEYQPQHEAAFDAMLKRLRASPEWAFVEREVDLRLQLAVPLT